MLPRILLAVPVFNEARYVLGVLNEAHRLADDILVIDDGSTDSTPNLLADQQIAAVIRHAENRGYGASLASAFAYAAGRGYDWLISMDCDEQHEPALIPEFAAAAARDEHDIISGSRYLRVFDGDDAPPPDRRRINARITATLNARLGFGMTDAFCGFKAYRVAALRHFTITVPGYAMPIQLWVQAWCAGLRVTEIPVRLIYNDPTRHFGGMLDDPTERFEHYMRVLEAELADDACVSFGSRTCGATNS